MADADPLLLERDGAVAVVTLNRPDRLNAIHWDLCVELGGVLDALALDDSVRAVVLTGAGRAFCAGGDIKAQAARRGMPVPEKVARAAPMLRAVRTIWGFPKPLLAAVNGPAAGAGAGLALLCDVRYAARTARLGFPFAKVGLGPDFGVTFTLPRVVGPGVAAELLCTARYLDADEAAEVGLVDRVVADADLLPTVLELAQEIASLPPFGVRLAKEGLRRGIESSFATAVQAEMSGQFTAFETAEHHAAIAAFNRGKPER